MKGNLITSFPMTNSKWVIFYILWMAASSPLFLWSTVCEWHCTFCERQSHDSSHLFEQPVSDIASFVKGSHHIFSYDQQFVSDTLPGIICKRQCHHIFSYDQQLVSDILHFVKGSFISSFPMTNSKWEPLPILWKAVSSHLFLWPTACEWYCTFCKRQCHCIFEPYDQQQVSAVPLHILWKAGLSHLFLWPTASGSYFTFCERQCHHIMFLWSTACELTCNLSIPLNL